MPHALALSNAFSNHLDRLSDAFSTKFQARPRQVRGEDRGFSSRSRVRFRSHDAFVPRDSSPLASAATRGPAAISSPPVPSSGKPADQPARPQQLSSSSASARLKASSQALIRRDEDSGTTTVVQRDRLDFRLKFSQVSVGSGDLSGLADALEGQAGVLERLFEAGGVLADFSPELAKEFLARIEDALGALDADSGAQARATSLDIKIRLRTKTVSVGTAEDGSSIVEKSVVKLDVRVRFVSLSLSGDVEQTQEPVAAELQDGHGRLSGLGPLKQFDFNGDGRFSVDDIAALADEIIEGDEQ